MGKRAAGLVAIVASAMFSECAPKVCEPSDVPQCEGNRLRAACFGSADDAPTEDCGARTCIVDVDPNGHVYGVCAMGGKRDALCVGGPDVQICDGERAAQCRGRYRESEIDCASLGLVCETARDVSGGAAAACVTSHTADPQCPRDGPFRSLCLGRFVTRCFGGFDEPVVDCGASGTFCHSDGTFASCVLDDAPDPRCAGVRRFCDGPRGFFCFDGRREGLAGDCTPQGKSCVATDDFFGCR